MASITSRLKQTGKSSSISYRNSRSRRISRKLRLNGTTSKSKTHPCNVCAPQDRRGFRSLNDLNRHLKSVHSIYKDGDLFWVCKINGCPSYPKQWTRLDNFKSHVLRTHSHKYLREIEHCCCVFRRYKILPLSQKAELDADDSGISVDSEGSHQPNDATFHGHLFEEADIQNSETADHSQCRYETLLKPQPISVQLYTFPMPIVPTLSQPETVIKFMFQHPSRKTGMTNNGSQTNGTHSSKGRQSTDKSRSSNTNPSQASHESSSNTGKNRKTRNEHERDEYGGTTPWRSPKEAKNGKTCKYFACPFLKKDATQNYPCAIHCFQDIPSLRQHLSRQHLRPEHPCSVCLEAFASDGEKRQHELRNRCVPNPTGRLGLMTTEANQRIRRQKHSQNAAHAWYEIWDILFPDEQPPSSPYADVCDPRLEHQVSIFRSLGPGFARLFHDSVSSSSRSLASAEARSIFEEAYQIVSRTATEPSHASQIETFIFPSWVPSSIRLDNIGTAQQADLAALGSTFSGEYSTLPFTQGPPDNRTGLAVECVESASQHGVLDSRTASSITQQEEARPSPFSARITYLDWDDESPCNECHRPARTPTSSCPQSGCQTPTTPPLDPDASPASPLNVSAASTPREQRQTPAALTEESERAAAIFAHILRLLCDQARQESSSPLRLCSGAGADTQSSNETPRANSARSGQARQGTDAGRGRKRKPKGEANPNEQVNTSNANTNKKQKAEKQYLACPFCKKNPQRYSYLNFNRLEAAYRKCCTAEIHTISALRQHIKRTHQRPSHYCGLCYVPFENALDFERHQRERLDFERPERDRSCQPIDTSPYSDCADATSLQMIENVRTQNGDVAEAWYMIWDILFPDADRPHSPYAGDIDIIIQYQVEIFRFLGPMAEFMYNQLCRPNGLPPLTQEILERAFIMSTNRQDNASASEEHAALQGWSRLNVSGMPALQEVAGQVHTSSFNFNMAHLAPSYDYGLPVERSSSQYRPSTSMRSLPSLNNVVATPSSHNTSRTPDLRPQVPLQFIFDPSLMEVPQSYMSDYSQLETAEPMASLVGPAAAADGVLFPYPYEQTTYVDPNGRHAEISLLQFCNSVDRIEQSEESVSNRQNRPTQM